jgi:hypothetical protein
MLLGTQTIISNRSNPLTLFANFPLFFIATKLESMVKMSSMLFKLDNVIEIFLLIDSPNETFWKYQTMVYMSQIMNIIFNRWAEFEIT